MSVLSERGVARREAGLLALKGVVRRRGRRRVAVRAAGALMVLLAAGVAVVMARVGGPSGIPVPVTPEAVALGPAPEIRYEVVNVAGVQLIKTDPTVVGEFAPRPRAVFRLDDVGLQRALREAGEPAGLVRIGKRVTVERELWPAEAGM